MSAETREMLLILAAMIPWFVIAAGLIWSFVATSLDRARAGRPVRGHRRAPTRGWAAGDQLRPTAGPAADRTQATSTRPARRPASADVRSAGA